MSTGANVAVSKFCNIIQGYLKSVHCSLNVLHSHIKCFTFASSGFMKDFFLKNWKLFVHAPLVSVIFECDVVI